MVDGFNYRKQSEESFNPTFSSTLLEAIYRSIDGGEEDTVTDHRESMRKKKHSTCQGMGNVRGDKFQSKEEIANFQRACMIEKWMEKKVIEKAGERRKSAAAVRKLSKDGEEISSSSSWDSSCGGRAGFFSSSESESFQGRRSKPIRVVGNFSLEKEKLSRHQKPSNNQDGLLKKNSRSLEIYGDSRKVKQPISPGARLAGFLNSIFTSNNWNSRKPKMNDSEIKSLKASSFSRSCLSKTGGKSAVPEKRSVRFTPVSVIMDKDSQLSINTKKQNLEAIKEEILVHVMEKNRRVEEAARDLLRNYQKKMDDKFQFDSKNQLFDQDDEDDAASYASSDLFELDNLFTTGMGCREELPVYETTHLHKNRAIANGFIF